MDWYFLLVVFLFFYRVHQLLQSFREGCALSAVPQRFSIPGNCLDGVILVVAVARIRRASAHLYREEYRPWHRCFPLLLRSEALFHGCGIGLVVDRLR